MDPDAALKRAINALCRTPGPTCTVEDLEIAGEALADLADWIGGGGFLPRWPVDGPDLHDAISATLDHVAIVAQVTRVCWAIDAIDGDVSESRRRVLLAVNVLRFACRDTAETLKRVERLTDAQILAVSWWLARGLLG